jgi:hypothetical protein
MRKCPNCGGDDVRVLETRDAAEDRIKRRRQCGSQNCGHRWVTLEILQDHVETSKPCTLPQAISTPLFDLESALETAVQDAVACLVEAVKPGTPTDKVKVELARWMVEDRRKWRIGIAEHAAATGQEPADPAVAQLANILRLVGDE